MTESATSSEFLLGLEEYLKYLEQPSTAAQLHTISRSLQSETPRLAIARSYLQQLSAQLPPELIDLADLCHGITKNSHSTEAVYRSVLTYCARVLKKTEHDQELASLADLCHSINRSQQLPEDLYRALLQYNARVLKTKGLENLGRDTEIVLRSMDQEDIDHFVIKTQLSKLDQQFPNDKIFRGINNLLKSDADKGSINDAFSRSQIKSKIWLVEELSKLDTDENRRLGIFPLKGPVMSNVVVMAGWFGQLKSIFDKKLNYKKMRIIELDKQACEVSDYIFNLSELENYKVKAVNADINELTLHKNGYEWNVENFRDGAAYSEKFLPDLIINTSAEHMTEEWFHQLRFKQLDSDPIVAIQSNNLFDIAEHVNCVHSVDHMIKKFPMREVIFAGELQLKGYKRVMLIGRP
jgi:hypothetical protein